VSRPSLLYLRGPAKVGCFFGGVDGVRCYHRAAMECVVGANRGERGAPGSQLDEACGAPPSTKIRDRLK